MNHNTESRFFSIIYMTQKWSKTLSSHTQIMRTNFFPEKALMKWSWKNFPEKLLTHDPKSENKLFSWVGTQEIRLEKFSRKAPHSWPEIRNFKKSLEKFSKKPSEWPPGFWKYFLGFGNMGYTRSSVHFILWVFLSEIKYWAYLSAKFWFYMNFCK